MNVWVYENVSKFLSVSVNVTIRFSLGIATGAFESKV